jgi:hypothetical protein
MDLRFMFAIDLGAKAEPRALMVNAEEGVGYLFNGKALAERIKNRLREGLPIAEERAAEEAICPKVELAVAEEVAAYDEP